MASHNALASRRSSDSSGIETRVNSPSPSIHEDHSALKKTPTNRLLAALPNSFDPEKVQRITKAEDLEAGGFDVEGRAAEDILPHDDVPLELEKDRGKRLLYPSTIRTVSHDELSLTRLRFQSFANENSTILLSWCMSPTIPPIHTTGRC